MKIDIDLNVNVGLTTPAMALLERLLSGASLSLPPVGGAAVAAVSNPSNADDKTSDNEPEKAAPKPRGRPKKAAEIPAPAEPAAEVAAQDAADEAAESAAQAPKAEEPVKEVFTLDSLRQAAGDYVNKFGMPAAQADLPPLIGFTSISAVPDDKCEEATLKVRDFLARNPNNHPVVAAAA